MAKRNTTKYKSNIQEKKVAKDLNAKVTVASGALSFQKADVRNDVFLVECKITSKDFYSLTEKTWNRIEKQALMDGMRIPLMCIGVKDGVHTFAVLNYLDFRLLELDLKAQYLGNTEPKLIDKSSYRINTKFIGEPFPQELVQGHYPCYREDIKFISSNKHLVILPWEDFLIIKGEDIEITNY